MTIKKKLLLAVGLIVIVLSGTFTATSYFTQRRQLMEALDQKLRVAVELARANVPADYHDHITGRDSVTAEEFARIVDRNNHLCLQLGLQYLWSCMEVGDGVVFTSATSPGKDVRKNDQAAFFELHKDPRSFDTVFATMQPVFSSFRNQWGRGRMLLSPDRNRAGSKYCFGVSVSSDEIDAALGKTLRQSLGLGAAFFVIGMLLALQVAKRLDKTVNEIGVALNDLAAENGRELAADARRMVEERNKTILEAAMDGFLLVDNEGCLREVNAAYCRMSGYSSDELLNMSIPDLEAADDPAEVRARIERIRQQGEDRFETLHRRKDGTLFAAEVSIQMRATENRMVAFIRDITDIKQAASALAQANEELERRVTERTAELKHSRGQLRILLDSTAESIYGIDMEGDCDFCNAACLRTLGYSHQDEVLGKNMHWLVHHSRSDRTCYPLDECLIFRSFQSGQPFHVDDEVFWRADGSSLPVEYWSHPQIVDGTVVGAVITFIDITERKRAQELLARQYERHQNLLDTAPVGVGISVDGIVRFANPRLMELVDVQVGHPASTIYSDARDRQRMIQLPEQDGFVRDMEIKMLGPNGETRDTMGTFIVTEFEGGAGILCWLVDIGKLKAAEIELLKAKNAAEAANQAKSSFLANMSHEIRTSMNAILGFAQLMQRDSTTTPQQRDYLQIIDRSGKFLLSLINDILEMAKIETGQVSLQPAAFDLPGLLMDLKRIFRAQADTKNLRFSMEAAANLPRWVEGDEAKLRQVFLNLLGNAVKFTHEGWIAMRVWLDGGGPDNELRLVTEIEDSGMGLSEDEQAVLFRRFSQTESGRRTGGGTGLGLAITWEIIRMMDGDITVHSQPGKGSKFRFRVKLRSAGVPARLDVDQAPDAALHLLPGQSPCRVLIVDDIKENRLLLCQMLAPIGFELREAATGTAAIGGFNSWHPHLILLDMRLPDLNGCEVVRHIRESPPGKAVKIVMNSASAFADNQAEALAAGADRFLTKPIDLGELFAILPELLANVVHFEKAGPAPVGECAENMELQLADLADGWLEKMREATLLADFDRIDNLMEVIVPLGAPRARKLHDMVRRYDATALLQFLNQLENRPAAVESADSSPAERRGT